MSNNDFLMIKKHDLLLHVYSGSFGGLGWTEPFWCQGWPRICRTRFSWWHSALPSNKLIYDVTHGKTASILFRASKPPETNWMFFSFWILYNSLFSAPCCRGHQHPKRWTLGFCPSSLIQHLQLRTLILLISPKKKSFQNFRWIWIPINPLTCFMYQVLRSVCNIIAFFCLMNMNMTLLIV